MWQKGDNFYIKYQIVLFNNFIDLPRINYFNYNITKYSKNLVDNALKAILPLLNKEQMGAYTVLKYIISGVLLIQSPSNIRKLTFLTILV